MDPKEAGKLMTEPDKLKEPGWVIEIRGYTYHHDNEQFVIKTLVENLAYPENIYPDLYPSAKVVEDKKLKVKLLKSHVRDRLRFGSCEIGMNLPWFRRGRRGVARCARLATVFNRGNFSDVPSLVAWLTRIFSLLQGKPCPDPATEVLLLQGKRRPNHLQSRQIRSPFPG